MRDSKRKSNVSSEDDVIDLFAILIMVAKLVVVLLALIICLRLPFIWIKLPAAVGVAYLGWRWISGVKQTKPGKSTGAYPYAGRRKSRVRQRLQSTIECHQVAFDRSAKPEQNVIQLLVAYDAAGEFAKAKTLIQGLDGEEFTESVAKELAVLAGNYFPIELETTETGVRFKLA